MQKFLFTFRELCAIVTLVIEMTINERIKARRIELNMSQLELANKLGYSSKSTICLVENGHRNVDSFRIKEYADALNCAPNWLAFGSDDDSPIQPPEKNAKTKELLAIAETLNETGFNLWTGYGKDLAALKKYQVAAAKTDQKNDIISMPEQEKPHRPTIYHYLTGVAAGFISPIEGSDYEKITLPEDAPDDADFCVDVEGNSMEPYIKDGSTVYVKRDAALSQFDVGIFFWDGSVYCKQICEDYNGTIHLLSANPKLQSANKVIPKSDLQYLVCYGKVILPHKLPKPQYL